MKRISLGHLLSPLVAVLPVFAALLSPSAAAAVINIDDFSGNETLETFDSVDVSRGRVLVTTLNGVTYSNLGGGPLYVSPGHSNRFSNVPAASLDPALEDNMPDSNIAIDFSTRVNRVGLLLSSGTRTTWTVSALDDGLVALGAMEVTMPANQDAVFAGLFFPQNIARLQIAEVSDSASGSISVFDDLRYEAVVPVPAAAWLFVSGLAGLVLVSRTNRRLS
ncbi:MAG: VPLPA-CTERM sorting domain-containing protein [Gammaproteobacteria bacterium]|jgi:hypothetical protein